MRSLVVKELVTDKAEVIANKECGIKDFFKLRQLDKLRLVYDVFSYDESTFDEIVKVMQPYIRERGEEIAQSTEYLKDPLLFTSKLLGLYVEF